MYTSQDESKVAIYSIYFSCNGNINVFCAWMLSLMMYPPSCCVICVVFSLSSALSSVSFFLSSVFSWATTSSRCFREALCSTSNCQDSYFLSFLDEDHQHQHHWYYGTLMYIFVHAYTDPSSTSLYSVSAIASPSTLPVVDLLQARRKQS